MAYKKIEQSFSFAGIAIKKIQTEIVPCNSYAK
jgi:hypothetical protein